MFYIPSLLRPAGLLMLALTSSAVNASLITQHYQAPVTSAVNTDLYAVGDLIEWFVTYDDAGTSWHTYTDGPDREARTSDDIPQFTYTLPSAGQDLFSDATFLFQFTVAEFLSSSSSMVSLADVLDYNYQHVIGWTSLADSNMSSVYDSFGFGYYAPGGTGTLTVAGVDSQGRRVMTEVWFGAASLVPSVPEPSALALMGLGLLGFAATHRKRQK